MTEFSFKLQELLLHASRVACCFWHLLKHVECGLCTPTRVRPVSPFMLRILTHRKSKFF